MLTPFRSNLKHPFGHSRSGRIYFIQRGTDGPIKIGFSTNLQARLRTLQTANTDELILLYSEAGMELHEARLHTRFKRHHITGEWFRPDAEILDYIHERKQGKR